MKEKERGREAQGGFDIDINKGIQAVQCYRIEHNKLNEHLVTGSEFVEMMGTDQKRLAKTSIRQTGKDLLTPISVRMLLSLVTKNRSGDKSDAKCF